MKARSESAFSSREGWPNPSDVERLQESCNFAPGLQVDHGHLGSVGRSCDFDQGAIHPIEPPDERKYCGQVPESVRLALPKDAPAGAPGTRILGNSSQMMSSARGRRISKLTCAKLPSLIQASFACASSSKERKEERSSREHNRLDISSRQITGRPVLSPICRAREVLPLPAHPRTTMRRGDTRGIRRLFNFRARGPRAGCGGKVSRQKKPVPLFNLRVTFGSIPADRSGS